ncbi:trypsin-like peptidase domain-containing protein [Actinosynnema sp. NPDC004786]
MRASYRERPPWLARVGDAGAGVLVAPDLVLTCAHVVPDDHVHVALVHLGVEVAATVEFRDPVEEGDLAVLRLAAPVPGAVRAPLRAPAALGDHPYVVQGFAGGHHTESRGRLGGRVGPNWVQLEHTSGHRIDRGFSGAPVWDDVLHAVVGIVVTAHPAVGGGNLVPVEEIVRRWPPAADHTGWRVDLDDAFDTHWLPRARGVEPHEPTDVWHFVGRHRALTELALYLGGPADGRVRAVVGGPGSGKSAVLARTVVLADRAARSLVPADTLPPDVALPPVGGVTVAVHARGRTLADVVRAIADAAEVDAADPTELLRRCGPVSVVVDALDEAAGDAPEAIATMLSRLAAHGDRHVVVGTRVGVRGALPARLGNPVVLDLDSGSYLDHRDVVRYAERRVGDPARAAAIARHAGGNFLIAQLACLTGARRLPTSVAAAVDDYLTVRFDRPRVARDLLAPLAFAQGAGLPEGPLWLDLANALSAGSYTPHDLREVLTSAAGYLVEQAGGTFRLFHQALDDAFRAGRPGAEPVVYETLRRRVDRWEDAPEYVREHLAHHAAAAGRLDELVEDVGFLVVAPTGRLLPHLPHVASARARAHAHVYRKAGHHLADLDVPDRAARLALTARQLGFPGLADRLAGRFTLPWRADVLAWRGEEPHQVLAQLLASADVGLWLDAAGEPGAFEVNHDRVVLHRFRDYRLDPVAEVAGEAVEHHQWLSRAVTDDGEVALTVADGALRKWSLADGPRETGALEIGPAAVSGGVAAAGRLFAALTRQGTLRLVDWTGDAPVVLDRVDTSDEILFRPPALGVQDGVVFAVTRSTTGLSLYRVTDDRLVRVGPRVRVAWRQEGTWFVTRPDGRLLLLCREDTDLACFGVTDRGLIREPGLAGVAPTAVAEGRLPGGEVVVATADVVGVSAWWLRDTLTPAGPTGRSREAGVRALAVGTGPEGRPVVLSAGTDGRVRLWEFDRDAPEPEAPPPWDASRHLPATRLFPTGDGRLAAIGSSRDGSTAAVLVEPGLPPLAAGLGRRTHEDRITDVAVHGDTVAAQTASGVLEAWVRRGARRRRVATGFLGASGMWSAIAVHDGRVVAHLDGAGRIRCFRPRWGRLREFARSADTLVDEYPGPTQGAFHRAAGGPRLLATHRRGLLLFAVPARGGLPLLATSPEPVQRFALDHGDEPVVATLSVGRTARVAVHALTGDAFTPWATPWPVTTTAAAEVALAVRGGQAFVAVGDGNGRLAVWSCPRGGRARRLLGTDLDSGVVNLAWRPDGRLVAWCRSGVVELAFG